MQTPALEHVNSIANETPPTPENMPEVTPAESGGTSALHGEIGAEKFTATPVSPIKDDDIKSQPTSTNTTKNKPNVVDKSGTTATTRRVAANADTLTTLADQDEEEFIVGVETAHNEHK